MGLPTTERNREHGSCGAGRGRRTYNVLSLFSGIGGIELGLRFVTPTRTVCFVEKDEYKTKVIRQRIQDGHLDDAPIWDNVCTFSGTQWIGAVDILTAGYPCQGFSSAARGRHRHPDLSGQVLRIAVESACPIVFVENVRMAEHSLLALRRSLIRAGYSAPPILEASAADLGAPHVRPRLFLLAYSDEYGKSGLPVHDEVERVKGTCRSLWERIPSAVRMDDGTTHRVDRLDCTGSAVVPDVAGCAFSLLLQMSQRMILRKNNTH